MNTKKWKRFFKLDPHLDGGFTLVELIVVIAILAILAGVGAMAYSGYIERTNRAADEAMIAEVEQALLLGAYSGNFAPGTVGAVVLNIEENAVCSLDDNNGDDQGDIDAMMQASFGANWKETVQLKSDSFTGSDQALILGVVKNPANSVYFNSVPNSSFYGSDESTATLVTNVDDIAEAFAGLLGDQSYAFNSFWSKEFREKVQSENLAYTTDSNTAANLTVLAAANIISDPENEDRDKWISSWSDDTVEVEANYGMDGYVGALVMKLAKYKAYHSYVMNPANNAGRVQGTVDAAYTTLINDLGSLAPTETSTYIDEFNAALAAFEERTLGSDPYKTWQSSGQADTDAKAFVGTMTALNAVEDNYVSADKAVMLSQTDAFTNNGAAELLDTMVSYSKMTGDFSGDYVVTLVIEDDGTPCVIPTIQK